MKYCWNLKAVDFILPLVAMLGMFWVCIYLPLPVGGFARVFYSLLHLLGAVVGTFAIWLVFFALSTRTVEE